MLASAVAGLLVIAAFGLATGDIANVSAQGVDRGFRNAAMAMRRRPDSVSR